MNLSKNMLKIAFVRTIPIMCGYVCLGIGFGVLLAKNGYNFIWSFLSSLFIYAGSMQYVEVDLLSGTFSLITAAIITVAVNIRHVFYGLSMLEKYKELGKYKLYCIFALTDETYSLVCSDTLPSTQNNPKMYFLISLLDQLYWVIGCTLGGLLGQYINFNAKGIGFVMTALFVVIFIEQWESVKNHIPALIGLVCSAVCLVICRSLFVNGASFFLIPSLLLICFFLAVGKNTIQRRGLL